jgi:kexin
VGGINQHDSPVTENINAARMIVSYGFGAHATAGDSHDCNLRPSTPSSLIAGVYALALEVNPKLGARDIQWLTVVASTKLDDPNIRDWQTNKEMGKHFSHRAGYGKLDVPAFINAARRWKTVGILASQHTPWLHVGLEIPHGGNVVVSEHELIQIETTFYDVNVIEHVVLSLRFKAAAHQHEELLLQLESPSGMISHFTPYARNATNQASDETLDMTFMSVAHWGDNPIGKWRLEVSRRSGARITPSMELIQWRLTFHGQPADGRHEVYWPLHNDPFGPYLEDMDIALPTKDIGGTIHDAVEVMHSGDKNHHDSPYRRVAGVFAVVLVSFVAILGVVLQCLRYRENRRLEDTQSYFAIGEDEDGEDYTEDAKMLPGRSVDV